MVFCLYLYIGTLSDDNCYPYIGIAEASNSHLLIAQDHIKLVAEEHAYFSAEDYLLTSRTIDLDLISIDQLVYDCIRQEDYETITWFEQEKCATIAYFHWSTRRYSQRHIIEHHTDLIATELINHLYPIMQKLLNEVMIIKD